MADWQMKFDEQQMREASDRKSRWLLWGVVLAVAVVAVGWWWHRRKMSTFGSIIDANVRQIAAQKQEIARIEATGTENSRQIEELKRQVAERQEQLSARLHVGTKLYDRLRQGEGISQASGKDLQCLVEFYALLRPMKWYQWEQRYHALTPKQHRRPDSPRPRHHRKHRPRRPLKDQRKGEIGLFEKDICGGVPWLFPFLVMMKL